MSRRRKQKLVPETGVFQLETLEQPLLEQVHIYNNEHDGEMNGSENPEMTGVQVKFEPDDAEYEATGAGTVGMGLVNAFQPQMVAVVQQTEKQPKILKAVRTQVRQILEDKTQDPRTASQSVENVIEDLLKRNEFLLAQNDALNYKPYSRRGRIPGEVGRSRDVVFPAVGQSTTFAAGPQVQGRITSSKYRMPATEQPTSMPMGQLLRPKSPTRKCHILERDKSHIGLALMETKIGSDDGEKIFRVQKHEMVCAVSSETKFMDKKGRLISSMDINYYWCNFCPFSTTNKNQLMQHVIEHRFHCKYCRYQSFARSDVIHHCIHAHHEFQEQANVTQYCTFLSDYLRIQNPKEVALDANRKRKYPPDDDQLPPQVNKNVKRSYEMFDVSLEQMEDKEAEDGESVASQDSGSRTVSASSSATSVSRVSSQHSHLSRQASPAPRLSSPMTVYRAQSPVLPLEPDTPRPVISHVFSASQGHPVVSVGNGQNSQAVSLLSGSTVSLLQSSPAVSLLQNRSYSPPVPVPAARSNHLYWSCGYCPFTADSQTGIKNHSTTAHSGKSHRYVALIKAEDRSTPPPDGEQIVEMDVAADGVADCQDADNSEEPPVLIKQEPVEEEDVAAPIKVRFPTPRILSKEKPALNCQHCDFTTRILGPLRNHILSNHVGSSLVGSAGNSKVFMCPRIDCTFRSSAGSTFLKHSLECTPWKDGADANGVEPQLLECLQATTRVAKEAVDAAHSQSKVSYEKFSCLYCKCQYMGSKKQTMQHVLKYHGSKCLVMRNVQAHRKKRRSSVFFCRWCQWEGSQKADCEFHQGICSSQPEAREKGERDAELDSGEEDVPSVLDVVSDVESDAGPPDITHQDHLDRLHAEFPSPTPSTSRAIPQPTRSVLDTDQMPDLSDPPGDGFEPRTPCSPLRVSLPFSRPQQSHPHLSRPKVHKDKFFLKGNWQQAFNLKKNFPLAMRKNSPLVLKHAALKKKSQAKFGKKHLNTLSKCVASDALKLKLKYSEKMRVEAVLCFRCNKKFKSLDSLKIHLLSQHSDKIPFIFFSVHHKEQHLKSKFYVCPFPDCVVYRYAETDLVQHYRTEHSHYPHQYLNLDYAPAPVEYRCRNASPSKKHKLKSISNKLKSVCKDRQRLSDEDKPYMCLYCDTHFYADTVPEMKSHYTDEHPGVDVVVRDMHAYRNKRASRLLVCGQSNCHFSSFAKDSMDDHEREVHSPQKSSSSSSSNSEPFSLQSFHPGTFNLSLLKSPKLVQSPQQSESALADKSFQFQCMTCGFITTDEDAMMAHVSATHASDGGATVVTCDLTLDNRTIGERYISV